MPTTDLNEVTHTEMKTEVTKYSVPPAKLDEAGMQPESYWENSKWPIYLGYLKSIPQYREAVKALARWAVGRGFETDNRTKVILENIRGWGEDSFQSIMSDMIIVKKTNGDAYAEAIRNDKGTLVNLKKLNPYNVRIAVDTKGIIIGYDEYDPLKKKAVRRIETKDMFHICNDRIANEIHGTSILESCQWVIDAKQEAMEDWRRISHRSTIRVLQVDSDNAAEISKLRTQYAEAIKNGEVLILPMQDKGGGFQDLQLPPVQSFLEWIRYLDNFFYQAVGVPKVIASSESYTEAASKVGYMTFEPVYVEEQTLLEEDLWNQLSIKVKFNRPPSLTGMMQESEAKNTGQLGIQPNEIKPSIVKNE